MTKILLVEDDQDLRESIAECLSLEGFEVDSRTCLKEGREGIHTGVDLVILDWMLPDGQGIELLQEMGPKKVDIPVIMLTARSDLIDKVVGLEMGASDYVTKPFEPRELIARIRAQLRRNSSSESTAAEPEDEQVRAHGIALNPSTMRVKFNGTEIQLTKMEFSLLRLFMESPGQVFSRDEILESVWGLRYPTTRTVDMHVRQLRQKFDADLFETVHGTGYRFKAMT